MPKVTAVVLPGPLNESSDSISQNVDFEVVPRKGEHICVFGTPHLRVTKVIHVPLRSDRKEPCVVLECVAEAQMDFNALRYQDAWY
jgi:hypothetical protein